MNSRIHYSILCRKKISILIFAIFIIFIFCSCSFSKDKSNEPKLIEPAKFKYTLYEVKRGSIENVLETNGVFVSNNEEKLYFKCKHGILKGIDVREGDHIRSGQLVAELNTDEINNKLKIQEIKIEKSQLQYEKMVNSKASDMDIKQASLDVEEQKSEMENIQEEIENSKLFSTLDGTVVKCTDIRNGEEVAGSDMIITIAKDNSMDIECFENSINKFKLNMNVNFNYKNQEYSGTVTSLNVMDTTKKDKNEKNTNSMIVKISNIPNGSNLGDFVKVYCKLAKKENVLIVPKKLIRVSGDYNMVDVLKNGKIVEKFVQLGISNDKDVEVVSGLEEGEKLIE